MNNKSFNIYISGVGGQGIGLLSETIIRAANYAGYEINGTDTHGLAQRGGTVASFIRLGPNNFSPLIRKHMADLVIGLEVHEALRGGIEFLKEKGSLLYYQVVWQPLSVRLGKAKQIEITDLDVLCKSKNALLFSAFDDQLLDSRMQNTILLATLAKQALIPKISAEHYLKALSDLLTDKMVHENIKLFEKHLII